METSAGARLRRACITSFSYGSETCDRPEDRDAALENRLVGQCANVAPSRTAVSSLLAEVHGNFAEK